MNGIKQNLSTLIIAVTVATTATTVTLPGVAGAAEIRLLDRVTVEPGIVQLGDVAELYGAPEAVTDRLAAIDLFPAPSSKQETVISGRRIMDVLVRRGVNFNEHRVSGASRVTLAPARDKSTKKSARSRTNVRLDREDIEATQTYLQQSIVRFLRHETEGHDVESDVDEWLLDFNLSPQQIAWIQQSDRGVEVSGGVVPYTGRQKFEVVTVSAEQKVRRFAIHVDVKQPRMIVVAQQDLPRGTVILETDVRLEQVTDKLSKRAVATNLDEVVGKESTAQIRDGKPIYLRTVREPVLVRRGETVAVIALSNGIRVETQGKAQRDGSLDQLILIETTSKDANGRFKSFQARVSNFQEVKVYAGTVTVR